MKKLCWLVVLLIALSVDMHGQDLKITTAYKNKTVETPGKVSLSGNEVTLKDVTVKCQTLEFETALKEIIIKGDVTIVCMAVAFGGNADIKVSGSGVLTIESPAKPADYKATFVVDNINKLGIQFKQK